MHDVDAGTKQQGEGHQAKGNGCHQGIRGINAGGLLGGLNRVLAASSHEALRTLTHWARVVHVTCAAIVAGEAVTGTGAQRAIPAGESERARAGEVVDAVDAGASVAAGVAGAVVHVGLAVGTGESGWAATRQMLAEIQTLTAYGEKSPGRVSNWTVKVIYSQ